MLDHGALFARHAPVFWLHGRERYLPVNLEDLMAHGQLEIDGVVRGPRGHVTPAVLQEVQPTESALLNIVGLEQIKAGNPDRRRVLGFTEGPYRPAQSVHVPAHHVLLDLWYVVLFAFNGTLNRHPVDQECAIVRVLVNTQDGTSSVRASYGSSHGNGAWFALGDGLELVDGVRPVWYMARGSHALYPTARRHRRLFGFGDDVTQRGQLWDPTEVLVIPRPGQQLGVITGNPRLVAVLTGEHLEPGADHRHQYAPVLLGTREYNQTMPAQQSRDAHAPALDALYKYQGGVCNLFEGRWAVVKPWQRWLTVALCVLYVLGAVAFACAGWATGGSPVLAATCAVLVLFGVVPGFLLGLTTLVA